LIIVADTSALFAAFDADQPEHTRAMAVMERETHRYKTDCLFTLDQRDYRAIEPLTPGLTAFRLLPADL
jgi:hypothetical protein